VTAVPDHQRRIAALLGASAAVADVLAVAESIAEQNGGSQARPIPLANANPFLPVM